MTKDDTKRSARLRALRTKVFDGVVPNLDSVTGLGLTWDDVNVMRKLSDQPPLPDPSKSRTLPQSKKISIEHLSQQALDAIGKPIVTVSGDAKRTPKGDVRTLSASTVSSWLAATRKIIRDLGGDDDVVKTLNDHKRVIKHLEDSSKTASSLSTRLHYITALVKYVAGLGSALAPTSLAAYRERAAKARGEERDQEVDRTDDPEHAVRAFPEIVAAVPRISDKFGVGSLEHLAALLHTEIAGLRDDLKSLPYYATQDDVPDDAENYYVVSSGRLYIPYFKTSQFFPPYDLRVQAKTRKIVQESVRTKPRKYLLGKATVSRLIKRAYEAVGMPTVTGVTAIRHSRITHEMKKNPSPANMKKIAALFKHDPRTSSNYFRATVRASGSPRRAADGDRASDTNMARD